MIFCMHLLDVMGYLFRALLLCVIVLYITIPTHQKCPQIGIIFSFVSTWQIPDRLARKFLPPVYNVCFLSFPWKGLMNKVILLMDVFRAVLLQKCTRGGG